MCAKSRHPARQTVVVQDSQRADQSRKRFFSRGLLFRGWRDTQPLVGRPCTSKHPTTVHGVILAIQCILYIYIDIVKNPGGVDHNLNATRPSRNRIWIRPSKKNRILLMRRKKNGSG